MKIINIVAICLSLVSNIKTQANPEVVAALKDPFKQTVSKSVEDMKSIVDQLGGSATKSIEDFQAQNVETNE